MLENLKKQYTKLFQNIDFKNYKGYPAFHFPGIGNNYKTSKFKIAFIGKETNGWIDFSELDTDKTNHWSIDEYLDFSSECINKLDILSDRKRTFSQFVLHILSLLYNINYYEINESHKIILGSYIWANLNIFECPETIIKNDNKLKFNKIKYDELKTFSSSINILQYIIKNLKPDIIFITDWAASTDKLNPLYYSIDYKNEGLWIIGLRDYKTKIVWTYHPRYMLKKGGIEYFANKIYRVLIKLNILKTCVLQA